MKFERKSAVKWFGVDLLMQTGIKVLVSGIFGDYADKREAMATNEQGVFDYSTPELRAMPVNVQLSLPPLLDRSVAGDVPSMDDSADNQELWFDYIADLGDGFDATFTVAKVLALPKLDVYLFNDEEHRDNPPKYATYQGEILVMGGDQVYPAASREEYTNRMHGPYEAAYPYEGDNVRPKLFAIPGNHDWYDGLTSFTKLFCQNRKIGNYKTCQKRSYFAIRLPHHVWIWGIDVQLSSDIDYPQLRYFKDIAERECSPNDKIILCTAEPAWVFKGSYADNASYARLKYFEERYIRERGLELIAVLTGDLHHYAHYMCKDRGRGMSFHRFTAGGGGAFLHATHNLPDKLKGLEYLYRERPSEPLKKGYENAELQTAYPSKEQSRRMVWRNLWFGWTNARFSFAIGILYTVMYALSDKRALDAFVEGWIQWNMEEVLGSFGSLGAGLLIPIVLLGVGFYRFADTLLAKWHRVFGAIHGIAYVLGFFAFYSLIKHAMPFYPISIAGVVTIGFFIGMLGTIWSSLVYGRLSYFF
jgi:hypothetical protein